MQKNTKGSALIWAIAVIMMLMVVFIGVLSLSHTYYSRSYSLNSRRQAELSAQSVLTDMVSRIESRNIKYTQFIPAHDGERETLQIELPAEMGSVEHASILRTQDGEGRQKIILEVQCTYSAQTACMKADMIGTNINTSTDLKWHLQRYY